MLTLALVGTAVVFLVAMLITRTWGKKTYDYRKGELYYEVDKEV